MTMGTNNSPLRNHSLFKDSSAPNLVYTAGSGVNSHIPSHYDRKETTNSLYESRVTYKYQQQDIRSI